MRRALIALSLLLSLSAAPAPAIAEPAEPPQAAPRGSWEEQFFWDSRYDSTMTFEQAQALRRTIERYDAMMTLVDSGQLVLRGVDGMIVPIRYDDLVSIVAVEIMTGQMQPREGTRRILEMRDNSMNIAVAMYQRRREAMDRLARIEARLARSGAPGPQPLARPAPAAAVTAPVYAPLTEPPPYNPSAPGFTLSDGPTRGTGACPTPSHWNIAVTTVSGGGYHYKAVAVGDGSVIMAYASGDRMNHIEATGGVSGGQLTIQARDIYSGGASSTIINLSPDCMTGTGSVRGTRNPDGSDPSGTIVASRY